MECHQWVLRHNRARLLGAPVILGGARSVILSGSGQEGSMPRGGVSCSNLAVGTHHLPEPSEANIHDAQLFWGLPEWKGTSES